MRTTKQKSARQEKRLASRYGGRVTPGSGNGWTKKNDVRAPGLSIEAKYTDAKQYTLKQADLHTAEKHALLDGRDCVFIVSFGGEEWAIVREPDFNALLRDREALLELRTPPEVPEPEDSAPTDWVQPMLPGANQW